MGRRTRLDQELVYDFADEFLVRCPKCDGCALVVVRERWAAATLTCRSCGFAADWAGEGCVVGEPVDCYFQLPLWLSVSCCGECLWAYNSKHLSWLGEFASAKLRKRSQHPEHGWSNQALISRLPAWIKSEKNRKAVLRGVEKLRQRLASAKHT